MEAVYFVMLFVLTGFFVWLQHYQQMQAHEHLMEMQRELNHTHTHYQRQIADERVLANKEITALAAVNATMVSQGYTRDLFMQFAAQTKAELVENAEQTKLALTQIVGHAAADAFGTYHENVDRAAVSVPLKTGNTGSK